MNDVRRIIELPRNANSSSLELEWRGEVRAWVKQKRAFADGDPDAIVFFFERALESVLCPNDAWFGVHKDRVSVVIGGLFLAALHAGKRDRGIWLLLDPDGTLPSVGGLEYHPTKPMHRAPHLVWGHADGVARIREIANAASIWRAISRASRSMLTTPMGRLPDSIQINRKKIRVSLLLGANVGRGDEAEIQDTMSVFRSPEELDDNQAYEDGAIARVIVNRYERDPQARERCIAHHGSACMVCGFDFGRVYGDLAIGFIHVHHLRPLGLVRESHTIDPVVDLRPVCPNCHAVIHLRRDRPFDLDEMKALLSERARCEAGAQPNKPLEPTNPAVLPSGRLR